MRMAVPTRSLRRSLFTHSGPQRRRSPSLHRVLQRQRWRRLDAVRNEERIGCTDAQQIYSNGLHLRKVEHFRGRIGIKLRQWRCLSFRYFSYFVRAMDRRSNLHGGFHPNHGVGSMPPETKSAPAALRPNIFTWTEHDFVRWNTAADGSGSSYANGATYPFTASTVLYAQWKSVKVVVLPAVDAAVTLSPFAANSSLLRPP